MNVKDHADTLSGGRRRKFPSICGVGLMEPVSELPINMNSRCQLAPFGQGGGASLFEGFTAVQVAVNIEMVVDRGMDGGEFLQGLYVPEFRHRTLPSSEWLV